MEPLQATPPGLTDNDTAADDMDFQVVKSNRGKKRQNSSEQDDVTKRMHKEQNEDLNQRTVFIKGRTTSIATVAKARPIKMKEAIQMVINYDKITMVGDSLRVLCKDLRQKEKLLRQTSIMDIAVEMSEPYNFRKEAQTGGIEGRVNMKKAVILGVPLDITDEEIKSETGACFAKRMVQKNNGIEEPKTVVILSFTAEENLPSHVNIGLGRHKLREYIPTPLRCNNCQRFGHKAIHCRSTMKCSRCGKEHNFDACTHKDIAKCANCGEDHSAAYKGCKKYKEVKATLEIQATTKMSYRDALEKHKQNTMAALNTGEHETATPTAASTSAETPRPAAVTVKGKQPIDKTMSHRQQVNTKTTGTQTLKPSDQTLAIQANTVNIETITNEIAELKQQFADKEKSMRNNFYKFMVYLVRKIPECGISISPPELVQYVIGAAKAMIGEDYLAPLNESKQL